MKNKITIQTLLDIAENLGWKVVPCNFAENETGYEMRKYSPAGQEFFILLLDSQNGKKSVGVLIKELKDYINDFIPFNEAQPWIKDGHGQNGAPENPMDVIKDMEECKKMMQELLNAWEGKKKDLRPFSVYRTIRIDGQFDAMKKDDATEAIKTAIRKVIDDVMAHTHTIEDGVELTEITDCGEAV